MALMLCLFSSPDILTFLDSTDSEGAKIIKKITVEIHQLIMVNLMEDKEFGSKVMETCSF